MLTGEALGVIVQTQGREDGDHAILVAEVRVQTGGVKGEFGRVRVDGVVDADLVVDGELGETGDELVGETDALKPKSNMVTLFAGCVHKIRRETNNRSEAPNPNSILLYHANDRGQ